MLHRYIAPPRFLYGEPSRIDSRHWQAGAPCEIDRLPSIGVGAIVLCATDAQYAKEGIDPNVIVPGLAILRAPMLDKEIDAHTVQTAKRAAEWALAHLGAGRRVMVTCMAGWNRSGLVSCLTLAKRHGIPGERAVEHVRAMRPQALSNDSFVEWLRGRR